MAEIVMPRLSDTMEEGTILRWLKHDGEEVRRGEELVEIETDKATMSYESDQGGVLQTVAGEGDTLAVGEVIAPGWRARRRPPRRPCATVRLRGARADTGARGPLDPRADGTGGRAREGLPRSQANRPRDRG